MRNWNFWVGGVGKSMHIQSENFKPKGVKHSVAAVFVRILNSGSYWI